MTSKLAIVEIRERWPAAEPWRKRVIIFIGGGVYIFLLRLAMTDAGNQSVSLGSMYFFAILYSLIANTFLIFLAVAILRKVPNPHNKT